MKGDQQTTMCQISTLRIGLVMCLGMATAFHPSSIVRISKPTTALQSSAFFDLDPVSKLNLDKVHYCADNFGKCSIEEMEHMKKALHTERLQHSAVGVPLDPVEELDHRLLEEDLSIQLALLKDEMGTLPPPDAFAIPSRIPTVDAVTSTVTGTVKKNPVNEFLAQGRDLYFIPFGVTEIFMYGIALMLLFLLPNLTQN
jgi:hypothetical protein